MRSDTEVQSSVDGAPAAQQETGAPTARSSRRRKEHPRESEPARFNGQQSQPGGTSGIPSQGEAKPARGNFFNKLAQLSNDDWDGTGSMCIAVGHCIPHAHTLSTVLTRRGLTCSVQSPMAQCAEPELLQWPPNQGRDHHGLRDNSTARPVAPIMK